VVPKPQTDKQTGLKEKDMETSNSILEVNVASRAVAFAAALFTTVFIVASTAVVFTSGAFLGA
jgi:hypothetical protein